MRNTCWYHWREILSSTNSLRSTPGPQCHFLHHLFVIIMKKKNWFPVGASLWSLYLLPVSVWVFSRDSSFLPRPRCALEVHWCLDCSSLSDGEGAGRPVQGWVPICTLLPGWALTTHHPELESAGWKIIILTCVYVSFLSAWVIFISNV